LWGCQMTATPKTPDILKPKFSLNDLQMDKLRDCAGGLEGISEALRETDTAAAGGLGAALIVIARHMYDLLDEITKQKVRDQGGAE
jgi:hypothetical protein